MCESPKTFKAPYFYGLHIKERKKKKYREPVPSNRTIKKAPKTKKKNRILTLQSMPKYPCSTFLKNYVSRLRHLTVAISIVGRQRIQKNNT